MNKPVLPVPDLVAVRMVERHGERESKGPTGQAVWIRLLVAATTILLSSGFSFSQSLKIGKMPPSSDFTFSSTAANGLVSVVDYVNQAKFDGLLTNVTFRWSNAPCPVAVSLGIYRSDFSLPHGFLTLLLAAERGPFDVTALTQTVTLSTPVRVQLDDRIAIRSLTTCGQPTGLSNASSFVSLVLDGTFPSSYVPLPQPPQPPVVVPIQVAVEGGGTVDTSVIPVVISASGQNSSLFRTSLQLYNSIGASSPAVGRLLFRGESSSKVKTALSYSLQPGTVLAIPDLLGTVGLSGLVTVDVVPDSGPSPIGVARIYNDLGAAGTNGFTEDLLNEATALLPGDVAVLLAPADPINFRFNLGIRTIGQTALTATLRDSLGTLRSSAPLASAEEILRQAPASAFFGVAIGPSDTITFEVSSGSVFVYGVTADNRTNDSSFQLARRVGP